MHDVVSHLEQPPDLLEELAVILAKRTIERGLHQLVEQTVDGGDRHFSRAFEDELEERRLRWGDSVAQRSLDLELARDRGKKNGADEVAGVLMPSEILGVGEENLSGRRRFVGRNTIEDGCEGGRRKCAFFVRHPARQEDGRADRQSPAAVPFDYGRRADLREALAAVSKPGLPPDHTQPGDEVFDGTFADVAGEVERPLDAANLLVRIGPLEVVGRDLSLKVDRGADDADAYELLGIGARSARWRAKSSVFRAGQRFPGAEVV